MEVPPVSCLACAASMSSRMFSAPMHMMTTADRTRQGTLLSAAGGGVSWVLLLVANTEKKVKGRMLAGAGAGAGALLLPS